MAQARATRRSKSVRSGREGGAPPPLGGGVRRDVERQGETRLAYSTGGEVAAAPTAPVAVQPKGATRLRLERRAAGRMVTMITGLPGSPSEVETLGRQLRTACGTGGTVRDGTVELQGDQREKVEAFLIARQIPSKRAGG